MDLILMKIISRKEIKIVKTEIRSYGKRNQSKTGTVKRNESEKSSHTTGDKARITSSQHMLSLNIINQSCPCSENYISFPASP